MEDKIMNIVFQALNYELEDLEGAIMVAQTTDNEIQLAFKDKNFVITIEEVE